MDWPLSVRSFRKPKIPRKVQKGREVFFWWAAMSLRLLSW